MNDKMVPKNVTPEKITNNAKEAAKKRLEEFIKEETKLVKGIFQCFESPGAQVKICVRKYPGVQPFDKLMIDGETYEVPLYVARHLNGIDVTAGALSSTPNTNIGTCSYPIHAFKWAPGTPMPQSNVDGMGTPIPLVGVLKRVKRYGFQSMEFAGSVS